VGGSTLEAAATCAISASSMRLLSHMVTCCGMHRSLVACMLLYAAAYCCCISFLIRCMCRCLQVTGGVIG
jgi:hypothetical protein